jgi:hypothetical protein
LCSSGTDADAVVDHVTQDVGLPVVGTGRHDGAFGEAGREVGICPGGGRSSEERASTASASGCGTRALATSSAMSARAPRTVKITEVIAFDQPGQSLRTPLGHRLTKKAFPLGNDAGPSGSGRGRAPAVAAPRSSARLHNAGAVPHPIAPGIPTPPAITEECAPKSAPRDCVSVARGEQKPPLTWWAVRCRNS